VDPDSDPDLVFSDPDFCQMRGSGSGLFGAPGIEYFICLLQEPVRGENRPRLSCVQWDGTWQLGILKPCVLVATALYFHESQCPLFLPRIIQPCVLVAASVNLHDF